MKSLDFLGTFSKRIPFLRLYHSLGTTTNKSHILPRKGRIRSTAFTDNVQDPSTSSYFVEMAHHLSRMEMRRDTFPYWVLLVVASERDKVGGAAASFLPPRTGRQPGRIVL